MLLENARNEARAAFQRIFVDLEKPNPVASVKDMHILGQAEFALEAAHVHAELALGLPGKPKPASTGGYA